jgi:DeoR family transcriptional regulator, aga operon transcriptional repressor
MKSLKSALNDTSTIDRRMKILEILDKNGQVKVTELSKLFKVSVVTIRNDLAHLEEKSLLIKTRGGGIKTSLRVGIDYKLNEKAQIHLREKQLIGKKAASIIADNDIVIIDSGTTTLEITKNLHELNNLTVITNALNIASQLVDYENMKVILLGGLLRNTSLSLIGPISENSIKSFYCDKVFLGVDGIDSTYGISTPNPEEAHLNKLMIDISKQVIVVTDSSKFKKRSFMHLAPMSQVHTVITDSNIPEDELKNLQNAGVEVLIA